METPQLPTHKGFKTTAGLVGGIVLLVVLIAGAHWLIKDRKMLPSPTFSVSPDTSGWQTYQNSTYGVTMQYFATHQEGNALDFKAEILPHPLDGMVYGIKGYAGFPQSIQVRYSAAKHAWVDVQGKASDSFAPFITRSGLTVWSPFEFVSGDDVCNMRHTFFIESPQKDFVIKVMANAASPVCERSYIGVANIFDMLETLKFTK